MYTLNKTKEIMTNIIYVLLNGNGTRSSRLATAYEFYLYRIFVDKFLSNSIKKYCPSEYNYLKKVLWDDILTEMNKPKIKLLVETGFSGKDLIKRFQYKKSKKIIQEIINIHWKLHVN